MNLGCKRLSSNCIQFLKAKGKSLSLEGEE